GAKRTAHRIDDATLAFVHHLRRQVGICKHAGVISNAGDACVHVAKSRPGVTPSYSDLAPENLTTLAHFAVSSETNLPKSVGELANPVAPISANRSLTFVSARPALIS